MCPAFKYKDLKLDNTTYEADATNLIKVPVTGGTTYTITKAGTAGIFYIDLVYDNVLRGDVDGNGKVEPADVLTLVNHLIGKTPGSYNATAADVNKDGKVDITDLVALIKKLIP